MKQYIIKGEIKHFEIKKLSPREMEKIMIEHTHQLSIEVRKIKIKRLLTSL